MSGIKVDVTNASATWTTISGWLLSPEGGFRWAVNIIQFVVIVLVFYLLSIVAGKAAQKAASRSKTFSGEETTVSPGPRSRLAARRAPTTDSPSTAMARPAAKR